MRWLWKTVAAVVLGFSAPAAGGEVGDLGDTTKLVIEGASEFEPDQLRRALSMDFDYQAAARPSADLDDLLRTIESRLMAGYRQAGHADALVTARHDGAGSRVVVEVHEGPSVVAGEVRIDGGEQIDLELITAWLDDVEGRESLLERVNIVQAFVADAPYRDESGTGKAEDEDDEEHNKPLFRPGQPSSFDDETLTKVRHRLKQALAEHGLLFAEFDVTFERRVDEKKLDLIVRVHKSGRPATIDDIQITGLKQNARQAVLDHLQLQPGKFLTREGLERIETRLRHCARFWNYDVRTDVYRADERVELTIEVVEYPHVPPLGEPLSAELEAVHRVGVWLDTLDERGEALELHVEGDLLGGHRLALAVSSQEGIAINVQTAAKHPWRVDHAAVLLRDFIGIYSRPRGRKFEAALDELLVPQGTVSLTPTESTDADTSGQFHFGMSMSSQGKVFFNSTAHPVVLLRSLQKAQESGKVTIEGDELTISVKGLIFKAEADTGALQQITAEGLEIRVAPGNVRKMASHLREKAEEMENDYQPKSKLLSIAVFSLHEYAEHAKAYDANRALAAESFATWLTAEGGRLAGDVETGIRARISSNRSGERRFRIRPASVRWKEGGSEFQRLFVRFGPALADELHPRGSAAWTLQREICFRTASGDDGQYFDEIRRLVASGKMGPLGGYLSILAARDDEASIEAVLRYALTRTDEKYLRQELESLLAEDSKCAQLVNLAGRLMRVLSPEQRREIVMRTPERWQQFSLAWLCGALEKRPGLTPRDALVEYSVDVWRDELREKYQRAMTDAVASLVKKEKDADPLRR